MFIDLYQLQEKMIKHQNENILFFLLLLLLRGTIFTLLFNSRVGVFDLGMVAIVYIYIDIHVSGIEIIYINTFDGYEIFLIFLFVNIFNKLLSYIPRGFRWQILNPKKRE